MSFHRHLLKAQKNSFILIGVLCLGTMLNPRSARAQEHEPFLTLEKTTGSESSFAGTLAPEIFRNGRSHPKANLFMLPPPPPPPSSVTPFQPNIALGGRTVAVDVSPSNTAVAIAASESGGLFLTTDSGTTWTHIDTLIPFRMSDVKFAPSNASIVIASAWADSQTANGGGIWRSADGGATWQKPVTSNPPCSSRASTWEISFTPGANDVYVGTDCGVAVSHDLGATWNHVPRSSSRSELLHPLRLTLTSSFGCPRSVYKLYLCATDGT